jgi:magnesium transporter
MWQNGSVGAEDFPVDDVSEHLDQQDRIVWVDFTDPTAEDLAKVEDELGVHELASEDALEPGQRAKLDRYRHGLFLVVWDITCPGSGSDLVTHEIKAFITKQAIVTMHGGDFDMSEIVDRWDANPDLASHGVPFLMWGLLDVVADHATATMERIEELIDTLEEDLFDADEGTAPGSTGRSGSTADGSASGSSADGSASGSSAFGARSGSGSIQRRSFALRKSLGTVRRLVVPMRDLVQSVLRGDAADVSDGIRPYFRDVADHVNSVADQSDSLRDAVSSVLETNLNLASNRQNLVMKKVTSWAAIIAIPTAITGFFGQNVKFPGEGAWTGLLASLVLIVATSTVLYGVFKRRDWL